jgi:ATP-dependent Clp protease ATP-binding subunit ClpA
MTRSFSDDRTRDMDSVDETLEPTFDRFTDRARRVVVLAGEDARLLGYDHIGTEHLLLGLIHEGDGIAARAMAQFGVTLESARAMIEETVAQSAPSDHVPPAFTDGAVKVLDIARRESSDLGYSYVATWHILLALIREGGDGGAQVLSNLGVDLPELRHQVIRQFESEQGDELPNTSDFGSVGDEWVATLVHAGRRPSDYAAAYEELSGILSSMGLSIEKIDEGDVVVTSVDTNDGPGLDLRVRAADRPG